MVGVGRSIEMLAVSIPKGALVSDWHLQDEIDTFVAFEFAWIFSQFMWEGMTILADW